MVVCKLKEPLPHVGFAWHLTFIAAHSQGLFHHELFEQRGLRGILAGRSCWLAPCHSDRVQSVSSHWVGARVFHAESALQNAALVRQSLPYSAPLVHHARSPRVAQRTRSFFHQMRSATRRRVHRGRANPFQSRPTPRTQLLTTLPKPGSTPSDRRATLKSGMTPPSIASLTSFSPWSHADVRGVSSSSTRYLVNRICATFVLEPTLETGLHSFLSEWWFLPWVKARHIQHHNKPLFVRD